MQEYSGQKPQLPTGWSIKPLPEELVFISGKAHEQHISEFGRYVVVNSKFISRDGKVRKFATDNFQPAKVGDILMVMSDLPNGKALAKTFLVDRDDLYAVNQRVCILRAKTGHPAYFRYQLNRAKYFLSFDDGVQQTHLLNRVFEECPVVVPETLDEQRAIAGALCDIDDLIASLDAVIAKKRNIKEGAIQTMLGGLNAGNELDGSIGGDCHLHARIGWQGLTVEEYKKSGDCILVTGTDFEDGKIKFSKCAYVDKWRFKQDRNIQLIENDILVTKDGTIGKTAFVRSTPLPTTLNSGIFVTRPKHNLLDPRYLFWVFQSSIFRRFIDELQAGSTIVHLYQRDFVKFRFPLVELAQQIEVAQVLFDMTDEIDELCQRRTKIEMMREGMMQQLLTGRIRLV